MKTKRNTNIKLSKYVVAIAMFALATASNLSCKKFLEAPQQSSETLLTSVADCQLLLDYYSTMNIKYPSDGEASTDDYFISDTRYNSLAADDRQIYSWAADAQRPTSSPQWQAPYTVVLNSNLVLEALNKIDPGTDPTSFNTVKGEALFFRAYAFYMVAQQYCKPYNTGTAAQDPGIPIRTSSDISVKSSRGTVKQTYDQITGDLQTAISLLPATSLVASRPNKAAAYAFLARAYLSMSDYTDAGTAANQALQLQNSLMDFNSISQSSTTPFSRFNKEVIFQSGVSGYGYALISGSYAIDNQDLSPSIASADSNLYKTYADNDLRKSIFFKANAGTPVSYKYTGNYDQETYNPSMFDGLATDEMYLIRAECYARAANATSAMTDLNTLLVTRWASGTYVPMTAANAADALAKILIERRKELIFRGLRWSDLRRLNMISSTQQTLTRVISGQTYTLPPNDPRYVLLLPADVIANSTMAQNPR
jgi:hypothetical protein